MKFWPFGKKPEPVRAVPVLRKQRSYNAAMDTARFGDFRGSLMSADVELREGLVKVRSKVRQLARNSSTIKRYITLMQDNVAGSTGFQFQCRVKKLDGTLDRSLNKRIEIAYWRWCKRCTTDSGMSMTAFQRQMVATWCRDGEFIFEIVNDLQYPDGIALNAVEADQLDDTLNTVNPATKNEIRMGVEINEVNRPVAYWFLIRHPGDQGWMLAPDNARHRRVPAERVVHVFERLRPGQTRGEPPAAAVVNSIKMLDGYREAEITNRRIASSTMGFFTRSAPSAVDIDALSDSENEATGQLEMTVEPGTLRSLPEGFDGFQKFDPGGSMTDYAQFEGQIKKDISMGLGISAFALGMETSGVSYSTGRSVLIEDRDFYKSKQEFFIDPMEVVFQSWLKSYTLSLQSDVPPSRYMAIIDDHTFRGRGWEWVDPAKDVKANAEALKTRQTSLSRIAASRGIDISDLLQEIADDEALMLEYGLTPVQADVKAEPKGATT